MAIRSLAHWPLEAWLLEAWYYLLLDACLLEAWYYLSLDAWLSEVHGKICSPHGDRGHQQNCQSDEGKQDVPIQPRIKEPQLE